MEEEKVKEFIFAAAATEDGGGREEELFPLLSVGDGRGSRLSSFVPSRVLIIELILNSE